MTHASDYGADELKEAAPRMRKETVDRLLAEEREGKKRSSVIEALEARQTEVAGQGSVSPAGSGDRAQAGQRGPTESQQAGDTPTAESVEAAKAAKTVPEQDLAFQPPTPQPGVQVAPGGPGATRQEEIAEQVSKTMAEGEGPFLGTGVGKIHPPAPAHAPGEPDPSGSHAAGMTARSLGAAPPAPTRFDGRDTGFAPRSEVGLADTETGEEAGGEPEIPEGEGSGPSTTEGTTSGGNGEGEGEGSSSSSE